MSSIGPQLPSHLSKRKRTPGEGAPPSSKHRRGDAVVKNKAEVDLNDSDDDDYGPRAPSAAKPSIGPSLPPGNKDEIDLEDSGADDEGPKAPGPQRLTLGPSQPPLNKDNIDLNSDSDLDTGPKPPTQNASTKRSAGPTAPKRPTGPAPPPEDPSSSDDDDDDDYGPALPSTTNKAPIGPQLPPTEAGPQRDEWMLAPPTSSGYTERDPTRMRNRKFASKSSSTPSTISSIWTETPEEKLKRLQNSVLGREDASASAATGPVRSKEEEERQRRISRNLEAQRGKSLYDEHQAKRHRAGEKVEEEDDPSKRGFDREKDMALGGKIGTAQRRELMNNASNFGGRFQKGSFL